MQPLGGLVNCRGWIPPKGDGPDGRCRVKTRCGGCSPDSLWAAAGVDVGQRCGELSAPSVDAVVVEVAHGELVDLAHTPGGQRIRRAHVGLPGALGDPRYT